MGSGEGPDLKVKVFVAEEAYGSGFPLLRGFFPTLRVRTSFESKELGSGVEAKDEQRGLAMDRHGRTVTQHDRSLISRMKPTYLDPPSTLY